MSFLSNPRSAKLRNSYVNGFLDCSGDIVLRSGNVIIGNISQPGYNANQQSLLIHGRTQMNGNVIVNGNLLVSSNNIALGLRAGNIVNGIQDGVPNGLNSTAVGSFSGMNHTGQNNTFMGSVAGQASSTTYFSTTGNNNTYVGHRTSASQSAWGNSTAVGTGAVITASNQIVLGTTAETVSIPGNTTISKTTASTMSTNGALVVTGGLGVGGAINAAGAISTPSNIVTNDAFVSVASTAGTGYLRMISTGSANYIQSGLNGTSDSVTPLIFTSINNGREAMRLDVANKRLGIGTNSPSAPLHVTALGNNIPSDNGIFVFNPTASAGQHAIIGARTQSGSGGNPYLSLDIGGVIGWSVGVDNADSDKFKIKGVWTFDSNDKLTITTGGNVGIGTNTPAHVLDVNGTAAANSILIKNTTYSTTLATQVYTANTWYTAIGMNQLEQLSTYVIKLYYTTTAPSTPWNLYTSFLLLCGGVNDTGTNSMSGAAVPTSIHANNNNGGDYQIYVRGLMGSGNSGLEFKVNANTSIGFWTVQAYKIC